MPDEVVHADPGAAEFIVAAYEKFPQPNAEARRIALHNSIEGLAEISPEYVARKAFGTWQLVVAIAIVPLLAAGFIISPRVTGATVSSVIVVVYLAAIGQRGYIFLRGLQVEEARRATSAPVAEGDDMPMYTILMPAYDEPEVIGKLVVAIDKLDYPPDRLELLLMIEEDDESTISVLLGETLPALVKVFLVPAAEPRTKPKACNYGLQFARGEYTTIYDAEDQPEPLQLRKAIAAFNSEGPDVACAQARLAYFNPMQNLITRWFTIEYTTWFAVVLNGLAKLRLPIPLGGTSNHMRTSQLRQVGGWDAFNVTEDAELGLRLARSGMRTVILDSVTYEEANSDLVNWIRQRSRWYKGYMQSWLVHFRSPRRALKEFGWRDTLNVTLMIGATPLLAAINLFTWLCTVVFIVGAPDSVQSVFPNITVYLGTLCTLVGNATVIYVSVVAMSVTEDGKYVWSCLLYPLYWILMAIAAVKACWQLVFRPSYWEKTAHGLNELPEEEGELAHA